ncbi:hypothetical protein T439DRAFT_379882 [Meredithblackwellia eburnea MCA 4105]
MPAAGQSRPVAVDSNSSTSGSGSAVAAAAAAPKPPRTRVWRACTVCRSRKIKCNGEDPCGFCSSNGKTCEFVEAPTDMASGSRQQVSYLDARLGSVETTLTSRLADVEALLRDVMPIVAAFRAWEATNGASVSEGNVGPNQSLPFRQPTVAALAEANARLPAPAPPPAAESARVNFTPSSSTYIPSLALQSISGNGARRSRPSPGTVSSSNTPHDSTDHADEQTWSDKFSHLAKDSSGNLRYIGGASSLVLVEALRTLRANAQTESPQSESQSIANANLELPFFKPGVAFRRFEGLPRPETTKYPDPIIADNLIHAYFTRFHHTFPILHKTSFIARYVRVMELHAAGTPSTDHDFLALLFAVFGCAAGLQAPQKDGSDRAFRWASPSEYAGIDYCDQAFLLYWIGSRGISSDHIATMALLSICHSAWNTLARSWVLAGHAVRAAQDLGFHRSPRRLALSPLEKEMRRRVWYCVYGLDRVLSISLGRPGGTHDDDCDTELPAEVDDEDLEAWSNGDPVQPSTFMTGFMYLSKIYIVAGKIVRSAQSLSMLRNMDERGANSDSSEIQSTIASLDRLLEDWVESLPDRVRYAANSDDHPEMVALCLLAYLVYYSAVINLHRPFIPEVRRTPLLPHEVASLAKCVSAAKCIIKIGEMVKNTIPTSHHLAFAIQYLTISGVILLRCVGHVTDPTLVAAALMDAEKCCQILHDLESSWSGARRCQEIISDLLTITKNHADPTLDPPTAAEGPNSFGMPPVSDIRTSNGSGRKRPADSEPTPMQHPYLRASTTSASGLHFASPSFPGASTSSSLAAHQAAVPQYSPLEPITLAPTPPTFFSPSRTDTSLPTPGGIPQGPLPLGFDFDLSSFAVGNSADSLPYGFDFLGADLSSLLDRPSTSGGTGAAEETRYGTGEETEATGQALWDALLGQTGQFG